MPTSRTSSWLWPEGKSGLLSVLIFPLALRNREICSRIANTSVNILRTLLCARHHVLAPWTLPVILCSKNSYYCFFSETLSDFSEATCLWNGGTSICTLALWLQSEFLKKIWWPPHGQRSWREQTLKNSKRGCRIHDTDLQRSWFLKVSITNSYSVSPRTYQVLKHTKEKRESEF